MSAKHSTLPGFVLTLALGFMVTGCDTSKTVGSSGPEAPDLAAAGNWVVDARTLQSDCDELLPRRAVTLSIAQDGADVSVYVDADNDGDFSELIQLPGRIVGKTLEASGYWNEGGERHTLDLTLEGIVWGSMTGTMKVSHQSLTPEPGEVPCLASYAATVIRVCNPPQFDLTGKWDVSQTTAFAGGPLQALSGSTEELVWTISQAADALKQGVFQVESSDDRYYIGSVNSSQIIAGGSFEAYGFEFHVTYSTLEYNIQTGGLRGRILADYGAQGEYTIGWDIEATRGDEPTQQTLTLTSSQGATVTVVDANGVVLPICIPADGAAQVTLPEGPAMVSTQQGDLPLVIEAGANPSVQLN